MNLKQKYFIDSHKGITPVFIIFLIYFYDCFDNINAMIYLALHGSYGILWVAKSYIYPDRQWEKKCSLAYGFLIWASLSLYWIAPFLITSGNKLIPLTNDSPNYIFYSFCISIYIFGIFLHFVSDMQKFIQLNIKPGKLIDNFMFSKIRNTNYLGELFIYLGFSLLAFDFIPLIVLLAFITFLWIPNMIKKDKSLSKYSEFQNYESKTKKFFPFIY